MDFFATSDNKGKMRYFGLLAALLIVFHAGGLAMAGPTGTLLGRVTDSGNKVIRGVNVIATKLDTNVTYSAETNVAGLYIIPNLPPGTYSIVAWKFGYRTVVQPEVTLHAEDSEEYNFTMEVGSVQESITMEAGASLLQSDSQRGGHFSSREVQELPLVSMDPISLARSLPGVAVPVGAFLYVPEDRQAAEFSVNGQRIRGNSYLLDSTENNDIAFTGVAQPFNIADAVEEVSVQTGNFGVEFGRATGGVFNVVTKSGTNSFHGTLMWRYQSQSFNSVSSFDKLNQTPQSVFNHNLYGFTLGGPVRSDRTFFFAGFLHDSLRSAQNISLVLPTEEAVATLQSLFPANHRLDLYLSLLGNMRGTANPIGIQLGNDPLTGMDRGQVQFASTSLGLPASNGGPQWLARLDHSLSESHSMALRYNYYNHASSPRKVYFPGFVTDQAAKDQNLLFTDQYDFSPVWTNEFRSSYARQETDTLRISPQSVPQAQTQPRINFGADASNAPIDSPGIPSNLLQGRKVNNLLFQDTQTRLSGRHAFKYGVEFLKQIATQRPTARYLGEYQYTKAPGYSAFANFLDDFSGTLGVALKDFGTILFYPNQFHQSYFFQDRWLPAHSLSLTLGIRYENFGQPANSLTYPAFSGFNPDDFQKPNRVNTDNNNFGPSFGLAWSPSFQSGLLGKLLGNGKTVWRGGYQISYDAFFTQIISLQLAASSPNGISNSNAAGGVRGAPDFYETKMPTAADAPDIRDPQKGVLEKNLRSPYTERWSFGFQREFSNKVVLDGSYVGSESHKLTTWDEVNPPVPDPPVPDPSLTCPPPPGPPRLHPCFGQRAIRASEGNSSYHAMQWRVDRRFADGIRVTASYTWSRNFDSTSEGVGDISNQSGGGNRTSVPVFQGGLKLDRGPSDYDRTHQLTVLYLWNVPGPTRGLWRSAFGGWSVAGITSLQSGAPFTVLNGSDRNNDTTKTDRPDIGNPSKPLNSRAVISLSTDSVFCSTGYRNPDTNLCVTPADVHWIEGTLLPNSSTVGRNTLRAGAINNFDLSLSKSFQVGEQRRLEFRWDALNALNHPQFTQIPNRTVNDGLGPQPGPSRFLNPNFTDGGIRSMWLQMKFIF